MTIAPYFRMRLPIAIAAMTIVASVHAPARAAEEAPVSRETHWYGGENLVADGIALAFVGTGIALAGRSDHSNDGVAGGLLIAGTLGWLTFSPIVHLGHRKYGTALGSFALRTLPILVLLPSIIPKSCSDSGDSCGYDPTSDFFAAALATALVVVVDDVALASEETSPTNAHSLSPTVSIARSPNGRSSTPTFGFAGVF